MQILSCVLIATPGTVAHQAPLSMGFPRQECWSGLPFHSLGDLPDSGIKLVSPALVARFFTTEPPRKPDAASEAVGLGWAKIPRFEPAPRRCWCCWAVGHTHARVKSEQLGAGGFGSTVLTK